jgi:uncharacterized protein
VRREYFERGFMHAARTPRAKPHSRFEAYFAFHGRIAELRQPQGALGYLALRRGQAEDELQLSMGGASDDPDFEARLTSAFEAAACDVPDSPGAEVLRHAGRIAFKNEVRTAIENEVHRVLKEAADAAVVSAFAESARRRLLAAPFGARPVIGMDPDLRGGSRMAALDASGNLRGSGVLELASEEQKAAAAEQLVAFVREHGACAVAVGDGSGGRELELVARTALREAGLGLPVQLVSEAGASAWAASDAARAELPDVEPSLRAAISLGRRLQDPLAELVRMEPKALGSGHYHHDVSHTLLQRAVDEVIEDAVVRVGVDLNDAPRALLARVPGVSPALAAAIVEHRSAHGRFATRQALLELPQASPACYEQAAGFLRVRGGAHPLDTSAVHPECYPALEALAALHGKSLGELVGPGAALVRAAAELDQELGPYRHADVALALERADRDPRPSFEPFAFRDDVRSLEHLKPGMQCPGLVTNVTRFGVFVDVGAQHDGLVHVSELDRGRDGASLQPGDRVEVRVLRVDLEKKQVSFTMRPRPKPKPAASQPRRPRPSAPRLQRGAPGAGGKDASNVPARAVERPRPARPGATPAAGRAGRESTQRAKPAGAARPPERRTEPRRQAFNNPFAVLADLKKKS